MVRSSATKVKSRFVLWGATFSPGAAVEAARVTLALSATSVVEAVASYPMFCKENS